MSLNGEQSRSQGTDKGVPRQLDPGAPTSRLRGTRQPKRRFAKNSGAAGALSKRTISYSYLGETDSFLSFERESSGDKVVYRLPEELAAPQRP